MKVSSLNKFKGKKASIEYKRAYTHALPEYIFGIVDNIEADSITVKREDVNEFVRIHISEIETIKEFDDIMDVPGEFVPYSKADLRAIERETMKKIRGYTNTHTASESPKK